MITLTSLATEGRWLDNEIIKQAVPTAIWETLAMTGVAGVLTALLGIPVGVLLFNSSPAASRRARRSTASSGRSSTSAARCPSSS